MQASPGITAALPVVEPRSRRNIVMPAQYTNGIKLGKGLLHSAVTSHGHLFQCIMLHITQWCTPTHLLYECVDIILRGGQVGLGTHHVINNLKERPRGRQAAEHKHISSCFDTLQLV
jgi:hypothetical protein